MTTRPLVLPLLIGTLGMLTGCGHLASPLAASEVTAQAIESQAVKTYYAPVPARTSGRTLLAKLHGVIQKHTDLGYDKARDLMFGQIDDVNNSQEIVDVYSGRHFRGVTDSNTAYERGLNTEHSWCQSNGAAGVARDDIHILFPVDAGANSARNNHPYGEVATISEELPDFMGDGLHSELGTGTGAGAGVLVFEPRKTIRGDVARAVLYFYTEYARFDGKADPLDVSNFKREEPFMIKWSEENPPTAAEIARNEAIFKAQGNRNPYVDHPEWVSAIGKFLP